MRDENIRIRAAAPEDAAQLLAIYTPYVERTAITFEYDVPTLEEFRGRIARTLQRYPYLTAERGGELLGYAYLSPFVGRAAYQWAAETSIYLRMDSRGLGLGRALYDRPPGGGGGRASHRQQRGVSHPHGLPHGGGVPQVRL